jgi:Domain of unknown function (DUF4249)
MKKLLILGLLASLLPLACVEEIDLSSDVQGLDRLIVDGSITDHKGAHQLRLLRPNKYGVSSFESIGEATVLLHDDAGNVVQYEPMVDATDPSPLFLDWIYVIPKGVFQAVQGRAYHLEIILPDGKTYSSTPQVMPGRVALDSIHIEGKKTIETGSEGTLFEQKRAFVEAAFTVPVEGDYWLRYEAESVGYFEELPPQGPFEMQRECYLTERFTEQRIVTQALQNANGKPFRVLVGTKNIDFHFEKSIYFTVVQRSMSKAAFDYWQKAALIANPQGSIFDPPPGQLRGNINCTSNPEEIPLGFFEVAAIDTLRLKVFNGRLGPDFYVNPYCFYAGFEANRKECKDCLLLPNSSHVKPHYWQ